MVSVAQLKDVPAQPSLRPDIAELRSRVAQIAPQIKARAHTTEKAGRVPEENIIALRNIGYFDIVKPAMFGGYEHDFDVLVELNIELAKSCASTAWVGGLLAAHQWLIAGFPEIAQRDVWGSNPDAVACGSYAPAAKAVEVDGGYRLTGRWSFASGCDNAQWSLCAALLPSKTESGQFAPAFLLVSASDYVIDDTWNVVGLSGTGSKTLVLNDVFVPAHRLLSFADTTSGKTPGAALYAGNPTFSIPMLSNIPSCLASAAVGAAAGALEDYLAVTSTTDHPRRGSRPQQSHGGFPDHPVARCGSDRLGRCGARSAAARSQGSCGDDPRPQAGLDRGSHRQPPRPGVFGSTCHSRHRSIERLDRRARPRSFQPGAARLARRQCRRPPHQHELGRRRHHVRPARARADAARTVLRANTNQHQTSARTTCRARSH